KFYAIDLNGKTRVIDQSLNVSFLPHVGSLGSRKFLVKSHDNLLAVEMLSNPDKGVGFRVFRMSEEDHKWDEMESLRDRILFLDFYGAVSAPASEFYWSKGNLIFYPGGLFGSPHDPDPGFRLVFVFDLETGTACPLENCPAYCNLFWPPPQWEKKSAASNPLQAQSAASNSAVSNSSQDSHLPIDHQFHSQETWSHDSFLSCGIVLAPWYLPSPLSQIVLWHYRYGTSFLPSMTIHPDFELKFPEAASLTCSCWCE
ncbi:hypothetical protein Goarm_020575, partial [Gossypium armourianum]|nr:hypothetical protein [Gossypium armourianum]